MRTTDKYSKILGEAEKIKADSSANGNYGEQQPSPAQVTKDFDVIAAEVRAIIMRVYETVEAKNIHS